MVRFVSGSVQLQARLRRWLSRYQADLSSHLYSCFLLLNTFGFVTLTSRVATVQTLLCHYSSRWSHPPTRVTRPSLLGPQFTLEVRLPDTWVRNAPRETRFSMSCQKKWPLSFLAPCLLDSFSLPSFRVHILQASNRACLMPLLSLRLRPQSTKYL